MKPIEDSAGEQKDLPLESCPTLPLFSPGDSKVHPAHKSRNDQTIPANFTLGELLLEVQEGRAEATNREVSQHKAERTRNMLRGNVKFSSAYTVQK